MLILIYEIIRIIENNSDINFSMRWHDTSHRIVVCRPAVRRSMLQAAKSWADNRNNMNNTRHNACNSLLSAEYVGCAS